MDRKGYQKHKHLIEIWSEFGVDVEYYDRVGNVWLKTGPNPRWSAENDYRICPDQCSEAFSVDPSEVSKDAPEILKRILNNAS